ncbi:MAG: hypothetical protein CFE21_07090 [Bacteroidetes bacterium B1(2017)]|nr:MAG: hypothetical protein CFE21_07090 [Bacteroidetes bacterium B1(2017)]
MFFSCSKSEDLYFREGGALLWINEQHKDTAIKNAVQHTLENSSIIIAQVHWSPHDSSFFDNVAWYFSLAKDHGKSFMIAVDWQKVDRSGTNGGWSFENVATANLFKKDMIRLLNAYNPNYFNLGVEVNYYALTSSGGFKAFASVFREIKRELKKNKPELKVGLSYQLELLYGHHHGWNETNSLSTLDNLLGDIDYLGISTYPDMVSEQKKSDVLFSTIYLDSISMKYSLPIGISETALSTKLYNEEQRKSYVKTIFQKACDLNLKFVFWGSMIDGNGDNVWSDKIGLLSSNGMPKNEFSLWKKENLNFYK